MYVFMYRVHQLNLNFPILEHPSLARRPQSRVAPSLECLAHCPDLSISSSTMERGPLFRKHRKHKQQRRQPPPCNHHHHLHLCSWSTLWATSCTRRSSSARTTWSPLRISWDRCANNCIPRLHTIVIPFLSPSHIHFMYAATGQSPCEHPSTNRRQHR